MREKILEFGKKHTYFCARLLVYAISLVSIYLYCNHPSFLRYGLNSVYHIIILSAGFVVFSRYLEYSKEK